MKFDKLFVYHPTLSKYCSMNEDIENEIKLYSVRKIFQNKKGGRYVDQRNDKSNKTLMNPRHENS